MDMFVPDWEIAELETKLQGQSSNARLPLLLALAWHNRQRDTRLALRLAEQTRRLLLDAELALDLQIAAQARLTLIEAEAKWLYAELDLAWEQATHARNQFATVNDAAGQADACWLLATIAGDLGNLQRCDEILQQGLVHALQLADPVRIAVLQAEIASWSVLADLQQGLAQWGQYFRQSEYNPVAQAWIHNFHGLLAFQSSQLGEAASYFMQTYETALAAGQIHLAILAAINVGYAFARLNDHPAALEWKQRGLALARPTAWPASIGAALTQTGETLRQLQRLPSAQEILQEACHTLTALSGSRNYAIALNCLGCLCLDQGDYHSAYSTFLRLEQRAVALNQTVFLMDAQCGQAQALRHLGRDADALKIAHAALENARQQTDIFHEINALQVIAAIPGCAQLCPADSTAISAPLHFLQQAQTLSQGIKGYTMASEVYYAMAREHANVGDFTTAYQLALAANTARETTHTEEAANRAIAMQVHFQTERARTDGEHHRQLAASEARRAEILQQTSETLERLGAIGQEITAHLEVEAIFATVDRHVHRLLDASCFAIYLVDADGQMLTAVFDVEAGVRLPISHIAIDDPDSYAVRCLQQRTESMHDFPPEMDDPGQIPGTVVTLSALFAPLIIGERTLGVMTIQSARQFAYGERERLIFRTLCAYGAIALDNADAYKQLQNAQAKLVAQGKLAALGSLVAGVAHELNTPIGNCLIAASGLHEDTQHFVRRVKEQSLRRSDLLRYCEHGEKASAILLRGLTSAADLVRNFKQVAVDRNNARRNTFDLSACTDKIQRQMRRLVEQSGHYLLIDVPEGILLDSYMEALEEVLANLIHNALLHAFATRQGGHLKLQARALPGTPRQVRIELEDDGAGISDAHLKRIFDPFFTTRLGQGSNGLGLSISYNLVTALLGGQISVRSKLGQGTVFILDLPLCAEGGEDELP